MNAVQQIAHKSCEIALNLGFPNPLDQTVIQIDWAKLCRPGSGREPRLHKYCASFWTPMQRNLLLSPIPLSERTSQAAPEGRHIGPPSAERDLSTDLNLA